KHAGHANGRRKPGTDPQGREAPREDLAEKNAERPADGEERRQRSSRGAAAERDRPGDELEAAKEEQRLSRDVAGEDAVDVVVTDAQGVRSEVAAHADRYRPDGRPPHPVDRQVIES